MSNLTRMVLKRLFLGVGMLFVISVLIFIGVEALPGDLAEAILGQAATPESIQAFRSNLKLTFRLIHDISVGLVEFYKEIWEHR